MKKELCVKLVIYKKKKENLIINKKKKIEIFVKNLGAIRFHEGNCTYHL